MAEHQSCVAIAEPEDRRMTTSALASSIKVGDNFEATAATPDPGPASFDNRIARRRGGQNSSKFVFPLSTFHLNLINPVQDRWTSQNVD